MLGDFHRHHIVNKAINERMNEIDYKISQRGDLQFSLAVNRFEMRLIPKTIT